MPREVYADTDLYTIEWDDEAEAIVHTWNEFASGEQFREGANELLSVVREEKPEKMLIDTRGIQAHDDEDQQWLQEEWTPKTIEAGVECSAMVHPDSVISEMDMDRMVEMMEEMEDVPYDAKVTSDIEEARRWLAEQ